jgi:uncharacterized membrane protein YdbT with pleckstrin-like domain
VAILDIYPAKPPTRGQKRRFSKYLSSGEDIVLITGISSRYFLSQFLRYLLLSFLLIGIPPLIRTIRQKLSYIYLLTTRRFLIVQGLFSRKLITSPLDRITHITVEQSFTERFFYSSGQVVIITAGYDPREIVIEHIGQPVKFKNLMEELTTRLEYPKEEKPSIEEEKKFQIRPLRI